jgi:hypothetical protein
MHFNGRRFPSRESIFLTMWACPAQQTANTSTYVYWCIWEQINTREKTRWSVKRLENGLARNKEEKICCFSVFDKTVSRASNYPALSMPLTIRVWKEGINPISNEFNESTATSP